MVQYFDFKLKDYLMDDEFIRCALNDRLLEDDCEEMDDRKNDTPFSVKEIAKGIISGRNKLHFLSQTESEILKQSIMKKIIG